MHLKEVSSAHQGCIYLIKNTEIFLQFKITLFYVNIGSKVIFSIIYSILQCHMILQKSL